MKTIFLILLTSVLLILLTPWSQADFFLSRTGGSIVDELKGEQNGFSNDIRLNTYNGRTQIVRQGALEAIQVVTQGWFTSASALAGSIDVQYFHVQLGENDAAIKICGGPRMNYGNGNQAVEWRGISPDTSGRTNIHAQIIIFPKVFDRRAYWIAAENRWAETAVEAVRDVVLEGLAHVERYIAMPTDGGIAITDWNRRPSAAAQSVINEQMDPPVRLLASNQASEDLKLFGEIPAPLSRPGETR